MKNKKYSEIISLIAEGLKVENYLEMGVRRGDTFNLVALLVKYAYAVDIQSKCYDDISHNENLIWYNESTDDFIESIKNIKIIFDLVFIDADHSHEQSLKDFLGVVPFVRENGIIILHDTYPRNTDMTELNRSGEVYKTAWYIRQNLREQFEIATLPFYAGLSIVRKCQKQLMWQ